ncbi:MAG: type I-C CRISPR-associated endonuclease Cas1 [bacterium]|jgi:CRISPR-associated protein Cas1
MKHLLNTLFVTTQGAYLSREGEMVHVNVERETKLRVPIHTLGSIVCFGNVMCSPFLLGLCAENNVLISFMTERGRFLARVNGPVSGNVLLRRAQYRIADNSETRLSIARNILIGKIANARSVLLRARREREDGPDTTSLTRAVGRLAESLNQLKKAETLDEARGIEGEAAKSYFEVFDDLFTAEKESFFFHGRNKRPPMDNVNALLSFLYTILVHDVSSALEGVGLDPAVGFLHSDRPGRPGLALDLMEELRPYLADRLALSLINRRQVKAGGFSLTESGGVNMDDITRKVVIIAWQTRKQDEIRHPFIEEKISIGLLPHVQAMLMARFLRGDIEGYPPFLWK